MKVVTVVGARPQFVKAAAVCRAFARVPAIRHTLIHTGQHYDPGLSEVFFDELGIDRPVRFLGVGSGTHGAQTGRMLEAVEKALLEDRPDALVVYGDTNSTLAGALAAAKLHVPVAHVEAGLRSFNRRMPEELNRILTDHLSDWLFAPTPTAVENLKREGVAAGRIHEVGDVMYDAALHFAAAADRSSRILQTLGLAAGGYALATVHRAENTDARARLEAIGAGLSDLAAEIPVVFPIHPRTKAALGPEGRLPGVRVIDPVGYLDMIALEKGARMILTDSGGVQKEAFFFGVPCVTLRDETEWPETVERGANVLVGADRERLAAAARERLKGSRAMPPAGEFYGGGKAAVRVAELLLQGRRS